MKIANFDLRQDVLLIAEIGNNHEGSYSLAEKMIGLAAQAGANAVKFQTIIPERLVSSLDKERIQQLKKFQLSYKEFKKLRDVAQSENVLFLSTPFDLESVDFLDELVPAYKIASGDNNYFSLIKCVAAKGKPIILSCGLADLFHIQKVKAFIENQWRELGVTQEMAVLHCVSNYPTEPEDANLLAIRELQRLNSTVGYSDHTIGIDAAILAVALGACIIEKHFTIDKNYSDFHDHQLSADPMEFSLLSRRISETIALMGDGNLDDRFTKLESPIRRSIAAKRNLAVGHKVESDDLIGVRPGTGILVGNEDLIVGKSIKEIVKEGCLITLDHLE